MQQPQNKNQDNLKQNSIFANQIPQKEVILHLFEKMPVLDKMYVLARLDNEATGASTRNESWTDTTNPLAVMKGFYTKPCVASSPVLSSFSDHRLVYLFLPDENSFDRSWIIHEDFRYLFLIKDFEKDFKFFEKIAASLVAEGADISNFYLYAPDYLHLINAALESKERLQLLFPEQKIYVLH